MKDLECATPAQQPAQGSATLGLPLLVSPCPCDTASLQAEQGPAHFGHRAGDVPAADKVQIPMH